MKSQIFRMDTFGIILVITFFAVTISAQQPVPNSNSGKGAILLSTINKKQTTNTYAVVVGISDYQDPAIPDLRFADKDAEAYANYLKSNAGGTRDNDHLKILVNKDATMAQFALRRYLEDHVSNEVAPVSQVPMIVGNRNEQLTSVDANMLATIKSGKTNQMMMLSAVESRGIEEDVLSKVDTNTII